MKLREVTGIHEIELSSVCNLACVYCPHPTLQRAKAHMPWHVLERAMQHVDYYCRKGTQGEVALTGIGEAILHPDFERAVAFVRSVIGGRLITLSTNGVAVDDAVLDVLQRYGVRVYVSLHRPEMASPAIHKMRQRGMPFGTNHAFVTARLTGLATSSGRRPLSLISVPTCKMVGRSCDKTVPWCRAAWTLTESTRLVT